MSMSVVTGLAVSAAVRRYAIAILVLICTVSVAQANETNILSFGGMLNYQYNAWNCPGLVCNPPAQTLLWNGSVTIITDSGIDGTYAGNHLLSFQVVSASPNWQGFTTDGNAAGGFLPATFAVTLAGGLVTSINGAFIPDPYEKFSISGLSATYSFGGCHHCDSVNGGATLTAVPAVPEPDIYLMLSGGLGLLGFMMARRRERNAV